MKYLIITEDGNGYHCGCCRRTWQSHETMEFGSEQELKEYIERHNKLYDENRYDNDSRIVEVYKLADDKPVYTNY